MNSAWKHLQQASDLDAAFEASKQGPVVLFKHSTRCPLSSMAMNRLQGLSDAFLTATPFYYLDLIAYRSLSASIAERTGIRHESPQILIIQDGQCAYHASHMDISAKAVESALA